VTSRIARVLLVVAGVQAVLGVLFFLQVPLPAVVWPFPGVSPLSNAFIGSIYLAAAASTAWCVAAGSVRALAGIALDYLAILVPFTIYSAIRVAGGAGAETLIFGIASLLGIAFAVWMLRWSLAQPWRDPRPTPRLVRWAFVVFAVLLVIVGGRLVLQVPDTMPWALTPELSTLFGFMFLGAAAYFVFGAVEPRWENAGGQLAGFLAYDLVLVWPFIERIPTIGEGLRLQLVLYVLVVVGSLVLAAYYLLIDPRTRLRSSRQPAPAPVPPAA
jgi:hypothetical protein